MRSVALSLLFVLSALGADSGRKNIGPISTTYEQIVPLVIIGEGWSQSIVIQNVDDETPAVGIMTFYTRLGEPWQVDLEGQGKTDRVLINLNPGQAMVVKTVEYFHYQELGWAHIDLDLDGLGDILCQTLYRKRQEARPDLMTSVVLSRSAYDRMSLYFDNTDGKYAGVGILHSDLCSWCGDKPEFRIRITDLSGNQIAETTRALDYGELWWLSLVYDFPETIGKRGILHAEPVEEYSGKVSGFSLQFTPNGAFTAIAGFEN